MKMACRDGEPTAMLAARMNGVRIGTLAEVAHL